MFKQIFFTLMVATFLVACAIQSPTNPPPQPTASPAPTSTPVPADLTPAQHASMQALATRANIAIEQIVLVSTEAVDWPDGCLGVYRTDQLCTQSIVPGFRIILMASGELYEYHTNQDGTIVVSTLDSNIP